jgi:hypothetical protein
VVDVDHVAIFLGVPSMSNAARASQVAMKRSRLRIHVPTTDPASSARWLINGYPAMIIIWTAEEWAGLTERPVDAQQYPNGVWCALRME